MPVRALIPAVLLLVACSVDPIVEPPRTGADDDDGAPLYARSRFDPVDPGVAADDDDDDDTTAVPPPCPAVPVATWFAEVGDCAGAVASNSVNDPAHVSGQAWGDPNGDGWLDLYVSGYDLPSRLFLGGPDGTFVEATPSPLELSERKTQGAVFVDYDNDGDDDLHVLAVGADRLLRNNGAGSWHDVSAASGLDQRAQGQMASWADFDGDGWLDVYVVTYPCEGCPSPDLAIDGKDLLFRNLGDGTFEDVSHWLASPLLLSAGYAAAWLDYDDDGDQDLYVVNDKGSFDPWSPGEPINRNVLHRNDGPGCGGWCFSEVAEDVGAGLRIQGMGVAVADYDRDGRLDLAMSDEGPPHLLRNLGGTFVETTLAVGWDAAPTTSGWGLSFLDHDNDGDLDLALTDGTTAVPNWYLRQDDDGGFTEEAAEAGFLLDPSDSTGFAAADYDRDGRIDLAMGARDGRYRLLRNVTAAPGRWIRVRLVGDGPVNTAAVGARLALVDDSGREQTHEIGLGRSLGSGHDLAAHFGLGDAMPQTLHIRWPDGTEQDLTGLAPNLEHTIDYPGAR